MVERVSRQQSRAQWILVRNTVMLKCIGVVFRFDARIATAEGHSFVYLSDSIRFCLEKHRTKNALVWLGGVRVGRRWPILR